jgi:hypothetical protein
MLKLLAFAVGIVALFPGCTAPKKTPTWAAVKAVRHPRPAVPDRDRAYAKELHETLQRSGVEHKVVTFTFRYASRIDLFRPAEGTAVIYRDTGTPAHPWWFMEESLSRPVWLPTGPVQRQVAFRLARPATIVKVDEFPAKPRAESHKQHMRLTRRPVKGPPEENAPQPAEARPAEKPKPEAAKKPAVPVNATAVPTGKPAELESQPGNAKPIKFRRAAPVLTREESAPEARPPPVAAGPGKVTPRDLELPDPVPIEPGRPGSANAKRKP